MRSGMGEVRVRATLTNAVDEALARRGLLRPEEVRTYQVDALVDTGAARSVLPAHIVGRLGLAIRDQRRATYADGRTETLPLTEPLVVALEGRDTLDDAFVLGNDVLIGQTVLEKLDLFVDCYRQRLIPNPAHPDEPVNRI